MFKQHRFLPFANLDVNIVPPALRDRSCNNFCFVILLTPFRQINKEYIGLKKYFFALYYGTVFLKMVDFETTLSSVC